MFVEGKGNPEKERGIYIDLFVFIHLPDDEKEIRQITSQLVDLHRTLLMKCGFRPWYDDGKILWKKRIGYILYQLKALTKSYQNLVDEYEKCILRYPDTCNKMNEQILSLIFLVIQKKWYQSSVMVQFEDDVFPAPVDYEKYLIENYGDYMQLPPVNERENRHQVLKISFGNKFMK